MADIKIGLSSDNLGSGTGIAVFPFGFKSLLPGSGIAISDLGNELQITALSSEATTASNLGTGVGVFAQLSGNDLQFKSLVGTGLTITSDADTVYLTANDPVGVFVHITGETMTGNLVVPALSGTNIYRQGVELFGTSGTSPISVINGLVSIPSGSASSSGYISSYDWSRFDSVVVGSGNYVLRAGDTMTGTLNVPVLSGNTISGTIIRLNGADVITSGTSSGTGFTLFNSKDANNLVFNSITGIGTVAISYANGVISISGVQLGLNYTGVSPINVSGDSISLSATTSDIPEGSREYYTGAKVSGVIATQKGAALGLATLDAGGLIPGTQLPPIAITDTFVVASSGAQVALVAEVGDVAVRTDENKSYILRLSGASIFSNWQELLTPTDSVLSVNNKTGAVSLSTDDINEGTGTRVYFTNARVDSHLSGTSPINYSSGLISLTAGTFVLATGDTMTGALNVPVLSGTTISGLNYVVNSGGSFLPSISGAGVGGVTLGSSAKPFSGLYVNNVNASTMTTTGAVVVNGILTSPSIASFSAGISSISIINNGYANKIDLFPQPIVPVLSNLVPIMTSNTAPSGVCSASAEINPSLYPAWKAFDHDTTTNNRVWATSGFTGWLQYQFTSAKVITQYKITSEVGQNGKRAPKNFTFKASNTGAFAGEEVTLDTQTGIDNWTDGLTQTFTISNAISYLYYRLNVTACSTGSDLLAIEELQLMGNAGASVPEIAFITNSVERARFEASGNFDIYTPLNSTSTLSGTNIYNSLGEIYKASGTGNILVSDGLVSITGSPTFTAVNSSTFSGTNLYRQGIELFGTSGTSPISVSDGLVSISSGSAAVNGYIASGDWARFDATANATGNYVLKSGDTMTGNLTLSGTSLLASTSNTSNVGSSATPFGTVFASELSGVNARGYVSAYNTANQTITAGATFQNITFSHSPYKDNWSHTSGTATFTCDLTGYYRIDYNATVNRLTTPAQIVELRTTLNGTEIPGSQTAITLTANTVPDMLSNSFILPISSGNTIVMQAATTTANAVNLYSAGSTATARPSIRLSINKI